MKKNIKKKIAKPTQNTEKVLAPITGTKNKKPYLRFIIFIGIFLVLTGLLFGIYSFWHKKQNNSLKIVLIGVDGGDWRIIQPLMDQGKLPSFKKLVDNGVSGNLKTIEPILSPVVWTSIATGKTPEKHGITYFTVDNPRTHEPIPITSRARTALPIWKILGDHGHKSASVGWWATWPAEPLDGILVTDRIAFHAFMELDRMKIDIGLTYPPEYYKEIEGLKRNPTTIEWDEVKHFFPLSKDDFDRVHLNPTNYREPVSHFLQAYATMDSYKNIFLNILKKQDFDFLTVYFEGVDTICHLFMRYAPPKMANVSDEDYQKYQNTVNQFYIHQDSVIGDILKKIDKNTIVIVVSDHGFKSGSERPVETSLDLTKAAGWHYINGIFIASGGPILKHKKIDNASVLDITPTLLALFGMPIGDDMDGKVLREIVEEGYWTKHPIQKTKTYEGNQPANNAPANEAGAESNPEMLEKLRSLGYINNAPSDSAERHNNIGMIYAKKGNLVEAVNEYKKALEIDPNSGLAHLNLGICYTQLNQNKPALEQLEIATRLLPNKPGPFFELGKVYQQQGQIDQAEQNYKKALELNPSDYETMNNLGVLYMQASLYDKSIAQLHEVIKKYPNKESGYLNLAISYEKKGDVAGAETTYQSALSKSPDSENVLGRMTLLYFQIGQYTKAEQTLEKLSILRPKDAEVWYRLAEAAAQLHQANPSLEYLKKAIAVGGNIWKEKAKSDPLLKSISSNPEFIQVTK